MKHLFFTNLLHFVNILLQKQCGSIKVVFLTPYFSFYIIFHISTSGFFFIQMGGGFHFLPMLKKISVDWVCLHEKITI